MDKKPHVAKITVKSLNIIVTVNLPSTCPHHYVVSSLLLQEFI